MDESHQATWKRVWPVLLTTLVPVVAGLGFFALATYAKKTPDAKDLPSMAAFDACLSANDLQRRADFPSQFDETIWAQQAMELCGDEIPPEVIKSSQERADEARAAYQKCVKDAGGSRGGGFGRFRTPPSSEYRNARSLCRSLLQGASDGDSRPSVPKTNTVEPIA